MQNKINTTESEFSRPIHSQIINKSFVFSLVYPIIDGMVNVFGLNKPKYTNIVFDSLHIVKL